MFVKAGREELVEREDEEIRVLKSYLPSDMSQEEIRKRVEAAVATEGNNFAAVMKTVMAELKGKADGAAVATEVRQVLNEQ